MSKGIIVVYKSDKCMECPMCYHSEDLAINGLQGLYKRLYRCRLEPEDLEDVYIELNKKPDWCPIISLPNKLDEIESPHSMGDFERKGFQRGWNEIRDKILKEDEP